MRFSVVIPVYNAGKLALNMIDSVLSQNFSDFEIIAVDDCSKDGTDKLLKEYLGKDERLNIVFKEENSGPALTRNEGLKRAKGEYVLFFDCDDDIDSNLLATLDDAINKNASDLIIYGHLEEYYKGNEVINSVRIAKEAIVLQNAKDLRKEFLPLERKTMLGYPWNKAYKRSIIAENNISFENVNMIEDFLFNVDFFKKASSLEILDITPYRYNIRESLSVTSVFRKDYFDLHERRIKVLYETLNDWDLCGNEEKNEISLIYARYLLSAIAQNSDKQSGMNKSEQIKWIEDVFESPLFKELSHFMNSDNKRLAKITANFKNKNVSASLKMGKLAHFVKTKCSKIFSKLKQNR